MRRIGRLAQGGVAVEGRGDRLAAARRPSSGASRCRHCRSRGSRPDPTGRRCRRRGRPNAPRPGAPSRRRARGRLAAVRSTSSPSSRPSTRVSPTESRPRIIARCEIDLSPGGRSRPRKRRAGRGGQRGRLGIVRHGRSTSRGHPGRGLRIDRKALGRRKAVATPGRRAGTWGGRLSRAPRSVIRRARARSGVTRMPVPASHACSRTRMSPANDRASSFFGEKGVESDPRPAYRTALAGRHRRASETPARTSRAAVDESGALAQLGERFHGMEEVIGSIPLGSTTPPFSRS